MIGSHDSFTYLKARSWIANLISKFWRCQNKSIVDQYKLGVRFFDIRVKRDKNIWRCCHGFAEFNQTFNSLQAICNYFTKTLKGCKFRIWLEKGSDADWKIFLEEIKPLVNEYPELLQVVRKNPETVYIERYGADFKYYCCEMEKFSNWSKGLYSTPIKEWAKKHNPEITQEMVDDPNTIYFMDYAI